jgi:hypothetical protein
MAMAITTKEPSEGLKNLIKTAVSNAKKLRTIVQDAIELGRQEGFTDKEIGEMLREEAKAAGLHRNTILPYLPETTKLKPRGATLHSNVVMEEGLHTDVQNVVEEATETTTEIQPTEVIIESPIQQNVQVYGTIEEATSDEGYWQVSNIENFILRDIEHYPTEYIEKTQDKIEDYLTSRMSGFTSEEVKQRMEDRQRHFDEVTQWFKTRYQPKIESKKHQPSPGEVEQRKQKVLSLVKEGTTKLSDIVERSEVSESAARRYLQAASYTITKGVINS